ncbi:uncharacterized protein LOC117124541 [Anneissia japonica]|uniref:uncharacterized protein LOC117124541 n=1 Tax=Anneissia japonica TaxID=1529436 RepID=UPI001425B274|nr:uncharacterized protein LOC117124541 [Anneissia japonica]
MAPIFQTSKEQEIEKKLSKLYNKCREQGLSDEEILDVSAPLLKFIKTSEQKQTRKKQTRFLLCIAFVIGTIAIIYQYDPAYRMLCVVGRLFSIQTLAFYDWTDIYFLDCALINPYYVKDGLTAEDCEMCQDLDFIEDVDNLDPKDMTEYLFDHVPVVVTDAIHEWRASKEFNLEFIKKLYKEEDVLAMSTVCSLVSESEEDFHSLIEGLGGTIPTWNLRWSNCEVQANKVLRRYFHRPYFLPDMVEVLGSWVFMASGTRRDPERAKKEQIHEKKGEKRYFSTTGWKEFKRNNKMQWMAQIKGQYAISLTPLAPCNETCQQFSFELNPGEILVFTPKMWSFEYMPYGEADAIALASMGDWE